MHRREYRRTARQPSGTALASDLPAQDASPLELTIGEEAHRRYETALSSLDPVDRGAVILRIKLCYDYEEIAESVWRALEADPVPDDVSPENDGAETRAR